MKQQQAIQDEANRKRSKTQKGVSKAEAKERAGTKCSRTSKQPERKAKAAASKTNPGAVARGDKLAKERPDLAKDGKRHYGDGLYKRAAEITGFTEGTLRDFMWMARAYELSSRKDNLSFKHHKEVASAKLIAEDEDGKLFLSDEADVDNKESWG